MRPSTFLVYILGTVGGRAVLSDRHASRTFAFSHFAFILINYLYLTPEGKTGTVIRIRGRPRIVRIRKNDTAVHVGVVARTTDNTAR